MINVLIVDDQTIVLQGIATLLTLSKKINVVATANRGSECIKQLTKGENPDVILLDIQMPEMNGIETLKAIQKISDTPVIFLTTFDDKFLYQQSIELGAKGWLLKNIALDDLVDAITKVAKEKSLLPSSTHQVKTEHLTPREHIIANELAEGKSNKEIALSQNLSPGTVKNYTSNLFKKLGVRNRAEAIIKLNAGGWRL